MGLILCLVGTAIDVGIVVLIVIALIELIKMLKNKNKPNGNPRHYGRRIRGAK